MLRLPHIVPVHILDGTHQPSGVESIVVFIYSTKCGL